MAHRSHPVPALTGSHVVLREPRDEDKAAWLAYGRDPEFVRLMGGDASEMRPLASEEVDEQYRSLIDERWSWSVEYEGRFAGTAMLHSWEARNRRIRYAIGIRDRNLWGMGIGTEITRMLLKFAFEFLAVHRVDLRVLEENARAVRCYEKCGFVVEGREREGVQVGGAFKTDLMMSILEDEYRAAKASWPTA